MRRNGIPPTFWLYVLLLIGCPLLMAGESTVPQVTEVYRGFRRGMMVVAGPAFGVGLTAQALKEHIDSLSTTHKNLTFENQRLRAEVRRLKLQTETFETVYEENARLSCLLDFVRQTPESIPARVIGRSPQDWYRTILIDQGSIAGVRLHVPVVTPDGIVGQVVEVTPRTSRVQLITDENSGIPVYAQETQVQGVVLGRGDEPLGMKFYRKQREQIFDKVLYTSGLAGVFPRDLPVGRVTRSEITNRDGLCNVAVRSAVNFDNIKEVLVLLAAVEEPEEEVAQVAPDASPTPAATVKPAAQGTPAAARKAPAAGTPVAAKKSGAPAQKPAPADPAASKPVPLSKPAMTKPASAKPPASAAVKPKGPAAVKTTPRPVPNSPRPPAPGEDTHAAAQ